MIIISEIATQKDLNKTFLFQIYEFYFCTKLCKYNNSFFKFLSKKRQVIYFLCQIQTFLYICTRLCVNWRLPISNMNIVFSNFYLKISKLGVFSPTFEFFCVLHETLHFDKFRSAELICNISFLKLQHKKIRIRQFQSQTQRFLIFCRKLCILNLW